MSFSKASAACLLESGLDLPLMALLLRSSFNFIRFRSLSGVIKGSAVLVVKIFSSDRRSRVSSFIRCTAAFKDSFSSNSDSRKALRSMAALRRPSKSSSEAKVLLKLHLKSKMRYHHKMQKNNKKSFYKSQIREI